MNAQLSEPLAGTVEEPTPPQQMVATPTTPDTLLTLAIQSGAGMDVIEKFMDLRDRWEAGEARKKFTQAMSGFKAEAIEVLKRKLVEFTTRGGDTTRYKHAELSDVVEGIAPALAKHELAYRWDVRQEGQAITVECILTHAAGHSERVVMTAGPDDSGSKNKIQQIASTVTYLQRYTLLAITGVATKGQDNDGRGEAPEGAPPALTDAELAEIRKQKCAAALGRHSESIAFIKERLAANDLKAAVDEWGLIPEGDQMDLWLAPSKGGCLTTEERRQIKEKKL
jgi:hypothetical protein